MNERLNGVQGKLGKAVREDPKKAVILAVLVAVMLVLWGRAMVGDQSGPAHANASPTLLTVQEIPAVTGGLRGGSGDAAALLQDWKDTPLAPVGRNLFHVKLDYFAQDPGKRAIIAPASGEDGFWDQLAKSLAAQADQRKERQILVENLQRQAAQLRVQTILMGEKPRALINGELVGEGDVAASFRVLRIESRRLVVEREGIRMEIRMQ